MASCPLSRLLRQRPFYGALYQGQQYQFDHVDAVGGNEQENNDAVDSKTYHHSGAHFNFGYETFELYYDSMNYTGTFVQDRENLTICILKQEEYELEEPEVYSIIAQPGILCYQDTFVGYEGNIVICNIYYTVILQN